MITKFDRFVNEGIFSMKKEIPKKIKYDCIEVDLKSLWDRFGAAIPVRFDMAERRDIALFLGEVRPLNNNNMESFNYNINKDIGFGISKNTKRRINVLVTKEKGTKEEGFHYVVKFRYPMEDKLFICGNLDSCFRKIKEVENSDNQEIEEPIRYEEPIEIDEL